MARRSPEIHGHRGSRGTHPENTLAAFREALDAGAAFFELDTQLTADDEPVVFHDPVLSSRVCTRRDGAELVPVPIREVTLAGLTEYECGSRPQPKFPRQQLLPGEKIPSLEETLAWVARQPGFGVNIEMKVESVVPEQMPDVELYTRKVLDLVEKHGLVERTLLQSFDFRPLVIARRRLPRLRLSCLFEKETDFVAEARRVGANAIGPHFSMLSAARIAAAHAAGLQVIPWTVNEPADWDRLVADGVDGLITDFPRELKAHLSR